ncbi:hypothetical protein LSAT2_012142 [Lamellibrachia satsuma]|nr:hypothetical protein LSAT2_012142 [Lamellibrachia satsuma]
MSTTRAARPSRQKNTTPQHAQSSKSDGQLPNMKNQPTAEQMRIAQMTSGCDEDPEIKKKINQIIELTGRTTDDALVALHDCDYDLNGAVEQLLENENDQGEWKEAGKKKKSQLISKLNSTPVIDTKDGKMDRDNRATDCMNERGGDWAPRGRRGDSRAPPRFRGRGRDRDRDRENDENERNRVDNNDRGFERGRGRGRGGRGVGRGGRGGGRGRGGSSSGIGAAITSSTTKFNGRPFEKGPQIDTWTNETAENAEKDDIGAWSDIASEDWATEDWTGTLNESKVFTASTAKPPERNGGFNDADTMFPPMPSSIETQVFSGTNTVSPVMNHSGDTYHHQADTTGSLSHSSLGQQIDQTSALSGTTQNSIGRNSVGHRVDLCEIFAKTAEASSQDQEFMQAFSKAVTDSVAGSQAELMSQYTREATETIKNAVGIGLQTRSPMQHECETTSTQQLTSQQHANLQSTTQQQQRQQQSGMMPQRSAKVQRTKLPPPSKIPASAVEMPGAMNYPVDVQFGNWDGPAESGFGFGAVTQSPAVTLVSNNYTSGNHLHKPTSTVDTTMTMSSSDRISDISTTTTSLSAVENMSQSSAPASQSGMFPSGMSGTPPKEYSQSGVRHTKQIPPSHEPFPSSQQSDNTAYSSQRQTQQTGSVGGGKSTSPMSYGGSDGYSSAYQSSYKSVVLTTSSSYTSHPGSGLTSLSPNNLQSKSQYGSGSYQTSSFPAQTGSSTAANAGQNLYPNEPSSFQSQTSASSYPSHTPAAFSSGSAGYPHQGTPSAYANQSGSSYQNQSSSYQRDTSYHSRGDAQSGNLSYSGGNQSKQYQTDSSQSTGSAYPSSSSQTSGSTYQRDSQFGNHHQVGVAAAYNSSSHTANSTMSSDKLSDSLSKMAVSDLGVEGHQTSSGPSVYSTNSTASASLTTTTTTTSSSMASGNVSVSSSLGLTTASSSLSTSSVSSTTTTTKSSLPMTTKAPPNLPPGVPPVIGHNYLIGQPGAMPFAAFNLLHQPTMYTYEDMQLLQQRLSGVPGYYDMPLQPPTTLTAARDHTGLSAVPPYTIGDAGKLGRVDAPSPVSQSSQQTSSHQQQQQQQPFLNPTIPPGYYNYYTPGGLLHGGYPYQPTLFQVPSVTNATHGGTTAAPQFQKPGLYGSHAYGTGYDDLAGQTADFSKAYGSGVSQGQSKASGVGSLTSSTPDIGGAGSGYNKGHTQPYDKPGFHAGTPPPFNLPLATGSQAAPLGAPTGYGAPAYMPMMPPQQHSQMLHHHMQQDSTGGSSRNSQQSATQPKPGVTKSYSTGYWGGN